MSRIRAVGLGLATVDVLIRLETMPTWHEGNPIRAFRMDGGGMAATAMVTVARLGFGAAYAGTAGNDDLGRFKCEGLVREGVDISGVQARDHAEQQIVLVYVDADSGERVFAPLEGFNQQLLRPEELDREFIIGADYLLLDGFHPEAARQAAEWMHAAGKQVVMDACKTEKAVRPHLEMLLPHVDILISGAGSAAAFTGIKDRRAAFEAIRARGPHTIVQTEGADGAYTGTQDTFFHTPPFEVEVVDTTGAGDVFHGAYIAGLLMDLGPEQTARFANAAAALKCTRLGGRQGIPAREEALAFLES